LEDYDYFSIKTQCDKFKLPMNKEFYKAKALFYDEIVLQAENS